jgi:integrase/recombinase XerD
VDANIRCGWRSKEGVAEIEGAQPGDRIPASVGIIAGDAGESSVGVVGYSTVTGRLLEAYLQRRRSLCATRGPLFLSESHRNTAGPLSLVMWSKAVQKLAGRAGLPRFTTHTPRHLRLTHLARARMDLHQIATYAGHRSLQTTMLYIHLSGVELTEAVTRSLAGFPTRCETRYDP